MRLTGDPRYRNRVAVYFGANLLVWLWLVVMVGSQMHAKEGWELYGAVWMICFAILSLTTAHTLTTCIAYYFAGKPAILPETESMPSGVTAAICCTVRNEDCGLYERLHYSLAGNLAPNIHFWLLSDSEEKSEALETGVIERLRADFPQTRICYRRRSEHRDFKPGNISEWLQCHGGRDYDYFFVLDADSLVEPGTIEKLLRKAEHPANRDVGHFQCQTGIVHDYTQYAHLLRIALEHHERLVFPTLNAIFGQWISYGHSNLIRTKAFLEADVPTNELSHDVWDAALLDAVGYRSVSVIDAIVYEEAPANYVVANKRDKRWTQGSLSALKLLFDPRLTFTQRFFVFHGAVQFINNFVFCLWLLLQYCDMTIWNYAALNFEINFALGPFAMNRELFIATLTAMITYLFQPFLITRNWKEVREHALLLLYSNLSMMNSLITGCWNVISIYIVPVRSWTPMEKNPFASSPVVIMLRKTLPSSLICLFMMITAWKTGHPWWVLFTSPMMGGGVLSPVLAWWSGTMRKHVAAGETVPVREEVVVQDEVREKTAVEVTASAALVPA